MKPADSISDRSSFLRCDDRLPRPATYPPGRRGGFRFVAQDRTTLLFSTPVTPGRPVSPSTPEAARSKSILDHFSC